MKDKNTSKPVNHYWLRWFPDGDDTSGNWTRPPGQDLSAMRRGANEQPGGSPAMLRTYTQLQENGSLPQKLLAEHICLSAYGFHQQSSDKTMHRPGIGLGQAMTALFRPPHPGGQGRYSEEATNRRLIQLMGASDLNELSRHLTSIAQMLKVVGQPLDYTQLFKQLKNWSFEENRNQTIRRWANEFYNKPNNSDKDAS